MIHIYHSKSNGGKSITMLMDAIRKNDKKIAIITHELRSHYVLKRLMILADYFGKSIEDVKCTVFDGVCSDELGLIKKIEDLKNEFDIIIVQGFYVSIRSESNGFFQQAKEFINIIHSNLFSEEKSKCEEVWIDFNSYNSFTTSSGSIIKSSDLIYGDDMKDKVSVKKYSYREYRPSIIDTDAYLNIIDFDERTIESHDMGKIFKKENQFN